MTMIKKIALTASIMLFILTQIFSFYVILASHQEKMKLLKEKESRLFVNAEQNCVKEFERVFAGGSKSDTVLTYCFRENMPEGSALYKNGKTLFNSSPYEFDVDKIDTKNPEYPCNSKLEKINGRYLLVLYMQSNLKYFRAKAQEGETYHSFYVQDITSVYMDSFYLTLKELFISVLASVSMAALLVYLIKKITRPLYAVNETQRQLIGSMSHELKTPLTAIKGYSETLLSVKLSKEQEERALQYIHKESMRLSRLSEKMMELTRLYEPECKIELEYVLLEDLFRAVESSVNYNLKQKGMTLVREGEFYGKKKYLDADLMTSFLINLVNNSMMASDKGSFVYLGADEDSLWVRDEGCGIHPEELDKVRKAFYRVDKSRSRKSGNMGLGLALCEQIAAVHHSTMELESRIGEGTKVSINFKR